MFPSKIFSESVSKNVLVSIILSIIYYIIMFDNINLPAYRRLWFKN